MKILFVLPTEPNIIFEEDNLQKYLYNKIMLNIFKPRGRALTFPVLAALTPEHYDKDVIERINSKIDYNKKYGRLCRMFRIHPKISFYCDRLQSLWIGVVGEKGSRRI